MIQDGSIGRGVRLTASLVVSMRARDIKNLKRVNKNACDQTAAAAKVCAEASGNLLSVPYGNRCNARQ
jgi:hypothetical protein